ncbi:MAG: dihydroneopterin aldolase [Rhodocyclaceae bacterium]|nr:dihydroneopterin aldolase [Rhodocyclaceae bacterium]MBX3669066.1 dihydroneopterin aldolase [Rhodocyclaceae bacterium]
MTALPTFPPDPTQHRRLFLRDFVASFSIGVHESERRAPQRVVINVEIWVPLAAARSLRDELDDVVDYDFLRRGIHALASTQHINLQETLCDLVADLAMSHRAVCAARVCTHKPDIYGDAAAVGVEICRVRNGPQP